MPKTLTEQWRVGKIKEGFYYVHFYTGEIVYRHLSGNKPDKEFIKLGCFQEILAPVPSYDEYNELTQDNKYLKSGIETRDKQIEQLEKQLEIATKALKEYANEENWDDIRSYNFSIDDTYFVEKAEFREKGYELAKKALKEMEGVK